MPPLHVHTTGLVKVNIDISCKTANLGEAVTEDIKVIFNKVHLNPFLDKDEKLGKKA